MPPDSPKSSRFLPPTGLPPRGRLEWLDTIRGILLTVMALNHIPSIFWPLTQQPLGFATAAEGFVFMAGLVVGLAYTRRWEKHGARVASKALWQRTFVIYKAHIATVAAILVWMLLYLKWSGGTQLPVGSPWAWFNKPGTLLATAFLLHQPGLMDILPTYCGLMLLTPILLWAFSHNRFFAVIVLSLIVWGITNFIDQPRPTIIGLINTGAFNFGAWQLLYVAGLALGSAWARGLLPRWQPHRFTFPTLIASIIFLSACSHGWITLGMSGETWFALSNKNNLGPIRLLNVALIVLIIHLWLRDRSDDLGLPGLAMLGRHSLAVFSVHCVAAIVILGIPQIFAWSRYGPVLGPALMLLCMHLTAFVAERRMTLRQSRLILPAAIRS